MLIGWPTSLTHKAAEQHTLKTFAHVDVWHKRRLTLSYTIQIFLYYDNACKFLLKNIARNKSEYFNMEYNLRPNTMNNRVRSTLRHSGLSSSPSSCDIRSNLYWLYSKKHLAWKQEIALVISWNFQLHTKLTLHLGPVSGFIFQCGGKVNAVG